MTTLVSLSLRLFLIWHCTSVPIDLYTNIPTVTKSIIYEDPPQWDASQGYLNPSLSRSQVVHKRANPMLVRFPNPLAASTSMSVGRTWLAQRVPAPLKLIIKDQFHPSPQSVENLSIPSIITVISNNPGVVYRQPALMLIGHISVREDHHPHISPKCGGQFWRISYCSTVPVIHCIHVVLRIHYHLHWPLIDPWGNFSY